jgi:cytochrome c oxidase accessory protein FixG
MSNVQPQVAVIKMYKAREEIFPREISGRFANLRWLCVILTQAVFYGFPWLMWNGRQAVLFDLAARKFYVFGIVLWPQDFIYLAALLIICAYGLFLVTAVAGRVWCGFGCPQTVYTELFLWIERKIEGPRSARMRLAKQPWTIDKIARKTAKHLAWGVLAAWTGFTFVAYFTPAHRLLSEIAALTLGPWEWFWIVFYSVATYGNAGKMREQVCKYMCPYARFQSAMFDKDTLVITYDQKRGEPRTAGARKNHDAETPVGDCIDCSMCVQVCPTGIDIRKGLQYECIGCAACIDACDSVMEKVQLPKGLIRYATERAIADRLTAKEIRRHVLRPRALIYSGVLLIIITVFATCLLMRTPLKMDVIRDRGSMGREIEEGAIENVYRLQIMNTAEKTRHFHLSVEGIDTIALETPDDIVVEGATSLVVPVRVSADHGGGNPGSNKIHFKLQAMDDPAVHVDEKAVFLIPR